MKKDETKILLVNIDKLYADGIAEILSKEGGYRVVGDTFDYDETLKAVTEFLPDILIVENRERFDGHAEKIAGVKRVAPNLKVFVITCIEDTILLDQRSFELFDGLIPKSIDKETFLSAVDAIRNDVKVFEKLVIEKIKKETSGFEGSFTERERSIISQIAKGRTNKEIASETKLTEGTVKNIISTIYKKANVNSRTELIYIMRKLLK